MLNDPAPTTATNLKSGPIEVAINLQSVVVPPKSFVDVSSNSTPLPS